MTTQTIEAVYEQGVFRLVDLPSIPLEEGQRVQIVIDTELATHDALALATSVFDGLSEQDMQDIDAIIRQRAPFFGDRS